MCKRKHTHTHAHTHTQTHTFETTCVDLAPHVFPIVAFECVELCLTVLGRVGLCWAVFDRAGLCLTSRRVCVRPVSHPNDQLRV